MKKVILTGLLFFILFLHGAETRSDIATDLSKWTVSLESTKEKPDSIALKSDSDIPWRSFKKVIKSVYQHGIYYISLKKDEEQIDISSNEIEYDLPVVVKNSNTKSKEMLFIFEITRIRSHKLQKNYPLIYWSILKNSALNDEISFFCKKIQSLNAAQIALALQIDNNLSISQVFDILKYIRNHLGETQIAGFLFIDDED